MLANWLFGAKLKELLSRAAAPFRPTAEFSPMDERHQMKVFTTLKRVRIFQNHQLQFLKTIEDADIVLEIGYHEELRTPLGVKQLTLLGISSPATIHRRLKRLRKLGVIRGTLSRIDGRSLILTISPAVRSAYCKYLEILRKK